MGCTDALRIDHQGVLEAAEVATGMAVTLVQARPLPPGDLPTLVTYARTFIEQVHHRREEEVLFPIVAKRLPHLASEVDRLRADHARARQLMDEIASGEGGPQHGGDLLAQWSRLVRAHTREEETYLLPIVERTLSPEACLRVRSGLARMERPGRERLVEPLVKRYLVPV
jgi:branched-chain amino acid transport system ATP-binding protein